jgi:cell division initiation protein
MAYSPVELRHLHLSRGLFGYRRRAADEVLSDVADSFEDVWRERGELSDQVEDLQKAMSELKHREELLTRTLVAAEQAASDIRATAKREAELVIAEAHQEARSIARGAQNEHARLAAEVRRMEALLRAALGMVEEAGHETSEEEPGAEEEPGNVETWPLREDTREFARNVRPVPELPSEPEAQAG